MPKIHINLEGSPFPLGNTLEVIRRRGLFCVACYNLSPATALALLPRRGLAMGDALDANVKAAERVGMLEPVPIWVNRGFGTRTDYSAFEVRTPLVDIIEAVRRGCPSCTLLERAISNLCPRSVSFDDPCLVAWLTFCSGRVLWVSIYHEPLVEDSDSEGSLFLDGQTGTRIGPVGDSVEDIEIYTLPGKGSPWPTIGCCIPFVGEADIYAPKIGGVARHIAAKPGSDAGFSLIKAWLDRCVNGHSSCREADSKAEHKLPKRVIKVGSDDNTTISLHEPDDRPGVVGSHYLALSHCWGQIPLPRLTTDTLEKKKGNILWESLPRTFQDVILVARGIGVEYVWIDSLCIIQDDEEDWETEAAKMSLIYEGALMVIAATASGNGHGGCLFEREPYVEIQATIQSSEPFSVFARKACSHNTFMSKIVRGELRPMFESDKIMSRDYPLFSRAWCFQERLLGTRILHFLRHEMLFECLETLDCECGTLDGYVENATRQLRQAVRLDKVPEFKDLLLKQDEQWRDIGPRYLSKQVVSTFDEDLFNETWRRVVETYSQKRITFPVDTFPALSGLANRWSRMTGKRYFCGLWADGLLVGLMWSVAKAAQTEDRETRGLQNTYIAPSWSWASARREIRWAYPDYDQLQFFVEIDIRNSNCVHSGLDVFGRINCGWIVVTGKVMSLTLESLSFGQGFMRKNGVGSPFTPDDEISCRELMGTQLVCLHYATNPPFQGSHHAIILTPLDVSEGEAGNISLIPENVKQSGEMYKRIGITSSYLWDQWNHEKDSQPATLIIL
ncbi:heterokaryon incompatibility protein-domain-containing protein [Xylaria castorea]|nr:heterokaryon incompatibility protein-domain-containing protein [Xylaria castorea]